MSNEYIYSYTSGSGSGSGIDIGSGTDFCSSRGRPCEQGESCVVVATKALNENIQGVGWNTIDWDKQYGPIVRKEKVTIPEVSPTGNGTLPRTVELDLIPPIRKGDDGDPESSYRCIKDCPPRPVGLDDECVDCINGEWVERPKVPCAIQGRLAGIDDPDGLAAIVIDWPRGTGPRTHFFDTAFKGCATPNLVLENEYDPAPWVVYTPPPCPIKNRDFLDVIPPPSQTQSSIFDIIRSQAGVTSRPVTNEPAPQSSIFSLVRAQAAPVTTIASSSLTDALPAISSNITLTGNVAPVLMMAQNVGTQSDGGGGLKCSVAPVSYTSNVAYNTGYDNPDEVVDNTTSYVKGYVDYTLSTDTITVIEPKL